MKVFIAHSNRDSEFVVGLRQIISLSGYDAFVARDSRDQDAAYGNVSSIIRSCDVLLAILINADNNVVYELGLASGAGIPVLLVSQSGQLLDLPLDIATFPWIQLAGEPLRDVQLLEHWLGVLDRQRTIHPPNRFKSARLNLQMAAADSRALESMSPLEFERLLIEFFREEHYRILGTETSRDSGADFVIQLNDGRVVPVEAKKLSKQSRVSVETVRQVLASMATLGAQTGAIIATSGYTASALSLAERSNVRLLAIDQVLLATSAEELLSSREAVPTSDSRRPWAVTDALNNPLVRELERVGPGEWEFCVGDLATRVRLWAWREAETDTTHFELSHAIKTPVQLGAYHPSLPWADDAGWAVHLGITSLTQYYEQAVKEGHKPSEEWLITNDRYVGTGWT